MLKATLRQLKAVLKSLLDDLGLWAAVVAGPVLPHRHYRESFFLWLANITPRSHLFDYRMRARLLRKAGMDIGPAVTVFAPIYISPLGAAARISFKGGFINGGVRFSAVENASITIGSSVMIGPGAALLTANHTLLHQQTGRGRTRPTLPAAITVEDDVWIAANATILPGVTIGRGAVVAAGAVVTQDVAPYTLVGGVPAKVIRTLGPPKA